ncbi:MAG: hypothetical protein IIU03_00455 [Bacteroidales bacterium]|nr:hypothetical protein [Bacteroidales bacterium]MEE3448425.1 hypothetical protein [Bacteroidales bacterium]
MLYAIFYKEWIKTRLYYIIAGILMIGFACYAGLYLNRLDDLAGARKLWEYFLMKNDSQITILEFVPLIVAIGGAVVQFAPEMNRKCLKLTLHLPYNALKTVGAMMFYGVAVLLLCSVVSFLVLHFSMSGILPEEIRSKILQTSVPWFLSGICGYLLTVWVVLQPVWKKRILQIILSVFVIKMFFITVTPGAYTPEIWIFVVLTLMTAVLSVISLNDFKEGKQD